jgi:hypothetical protein
MTLFNNRDMEIWIKGDTELAITLKIGSMSKRTIRGLFKFLNSITDRYPKHTVPQPFDEPTFYCLPHHLKTIHSRNAYCSKILAQIGY